MLEINPKLMLIFINFLSNFLLFWCLKFMDHHTMKSWTPSQIEHENTVILKTHFYQKNIKIQVQNWTKHDIFLDIHVGVHSWGILRSFFRSKIHPKVILNWCANLFFRTVLKNRLALTGDTSRPGHVGSPGEGRERVKPSPEEVVYIIILYRI